MVLCAAHCDGLVLLGTQSGWLQAWNQATASEDPVLHQATTLEGEHFPPAMRALACLDAGGCVVASSNGSVLHLDATGAIRQRLEDLEAMVLCEWSPGTLLAGTISGDLVQLDLLSGRELYRTHLKYDQVSCMALSPSRDRIAIGWPGGVVQLVDPATGDELVSLDLHLDQVFALGWLSEHQILSAGKDKRLVLTQLGASTTSRLLWKDDRYITALAVSPAGRIAFVQEAQSVALLESTDGKPRLLEARHSAPIQSLLWLDEATLASTGNDARLIIHRP